MKTWPVQKSISVGSIEMIRFIKLKQTLCYAHFNILQARKWVNVKFFV